MVYYRPKQVFNIIATVASTILQEYKYTYAAVLQGQASMEQVYIPICSFLYCYVLLTCYESPNCINDNHLFSFLLVQLFSFIWLLSFFN